MSNVSSSCQPRQRTPTLRPHRRVEDEDSITIVSLHRGLDIRIPWLLKFPCRDARVVVAEGISPPPKSLYPHHDPSRPHATTISVIIIVL